MIKASATEGDVSLLVQELRAEHAELESRLRDLEAHLALSTDEQLEVARLKKLKLATKDKLEALRRGV